METNDRPPRRRWQRYSWGGREVRWPVGGQGELLVKPEWWSFEWERFDGSWILEDAHDAMDDDAFANVLVRGQLVRLASNVVRRDLRAEDLTDDIDAVAEYVEELPLPPRARQSGRRLLRALVPFDPEQVTVELLDMAWRALEEGLDATARSLAELAYDAAASQGVHTVAQGAAHALSRLARLQECPRVARRWRAIAYQHGKNAARRTECAPDTRESREPPSKRP